MRPEERRGCARRSGGDALGGAEREAAGTVPYNRSTTSKSYVEVILIAFVQPPTDGVRPLKQYGMGREEEEGLEEIYQISIVWDRNAKERGWGDEERTVRQAFHPISNKHLARKTTRLHPNPNSTPQIQINRKRLDHSVLHRDVDSACASVRMYDDRWL